MCSPNTQGCLRGGLCPFYFFTWPQSPCGSREDDSWPHELAHELAILGVSRCGMNDHNLRGSKKGRGVDGCDFLLATLAGVSISSFGLYNKPPKLADSWFPSNIAPEDGFSTVSAKLGAVH